ncbi:MAG TPA: hypothetical protein VKV04_09685 [Verrucomicrobiae bacterium]|nr:hypothetical protein [Verrucomicrobiae bacterium]
MKVVLHNTKTEQYYGKNGSWVESPEDAHDFRLTLDAVMFATRHKLKDVEVSHIFLGQRQYDFSISISDQGQRRDSNRG